MARPNITGTLLRQIDMNFSGKSAAGGWSNKDYRISVTVDASGSYHVYTEYGPAGRLQNGQEHHLSSPSSASAAQSEADTHVRAKKLHRDSYKVVNDQFFSPVSPTQSPPVTQAQPKTHKKPTQPGKGIDALSPKSRGQISAFF